MSFTYFNRGSRNRERLSAHHRHAQAKRCICGSVRKFTQFCSGCFERLPDEIGAELRRLDPVHAGSPEWLRAVADAEQWLRMNPKN